MPCRDELYLRRSASVQSPGVNARLGVVGHAGGVPELGFILFPLLAFYALHRFSRHRQDRKPPDERAIDKLVLRRSLAGLDPAPESAASATPPNDVDEDCGP